MVNMHNPPHPGSILRDDVLPALGLSVTETAKQLGVTRVALSRVLNGHSSISPEMALKIEDWLGIERGGQAEMWAGMQLDYNMWQAGTFPPSLGVRCALFLLVFVVFVQTPYSFIECRLDIRGYGNNIRLNTVN